MFSTQSDDNNMEWFIPLLHEIQGGHYDWSEPHIIRFRQIFETVQKYLPRALTFFSKYAMPLVTDVMGEQIGLLPQLTQLMQSMIPKRKKK